MTPTPNKLKIFNATDKGKSVKDERTETAGGGLDSPKVINAVRYLRGEREITFKKVTRRTLLTRTANSPTTPTDINTENRINEPT